MPEISIIVPVYKVEKYIHRCVDSILAQTFTDFELILVDDGSPDKCGAICDEYAVKDVRVRVVHKENGGVSSARNAGLDAARGEYIMFCDGDDCVSADWCVKLHRTIKAHPESFVCCTLEKVEEDSNCFSLKERREQDDPTESCASISYFDLYTKGLSGYLVNKIFKTETIAANKLRFDATRKIGEDAEFCVKYCRLCTSCLFLDEALYYYIQHSNSAMHNYDPNWLEVHIPTFAWRLPLILEKDLSEYCDIWLYQFLMLFNNVFDPRCTWSLWEKLRYNQRMIQSEEFRFCLQHATGKNENPLVIKILRTHNYYLFWLFDQLVRIKGTLRRKQK